MRFERDEISTEDMIKLIWKTPTNLDILEKQMQSHEDLFREIQRWVELHESNQADAVVGWISLSDTLMKKTDMMIHEPNMTQSMTQRVEEMRSFIRSKKETIQKLIRLSEAKIALIIESRDEEYA